MCPSRREFLSGVAPLAALAAVPAVAVAAIAAPTEPVKDTREADTKLTMLREMVMEAIAETTKPCECGKCPPFKATHVLLTQVMLQTLRDTGWDGVAPFCGLEVKEAPVFMVVQKLTPEEQMAMNMAEAARQQANMAAAFALFATGVTKDMADPAGFSPYMQEGLLTARMESRFREEHPEAGGTEETLPGPFHKRIVTQRLVVDCDMARTPMGHAVFLERLKKLRADLATGVSEAASQGWQVGKPQCFVKREAFMLEVVMWCNVASETAPTAEMHFNSSPTHRVAANVGPSGVPATAISATEMTQWRVGQGAYSPQYLLDRAVAKSKGLIGERRVSDAEITLWLPSRLFYREGNLHLQNDEGYDTQVAMTDVLVVGEDGITRLGDPRKAS